MPLLNAQINNSITWSKQDTIGETRITENGIDSFVKTFISGTGIVGKVNKAWYGTGSLTTAQFLDLFSLSTTIFDGTLTTSFSGTKIKIIYVENTSTGNSANPSIYFSINTGAMLLYSGFTLPFNSSAINIPLHTGSSFCWINSVGYAPTSQRREIMLSGVSSTGTYSMVIIG